MFDTGKTLCEDVSHHIVCSDESEVYHAVGNALPDKMIAYINMFIAAWLMGFWAKRSAARLSIWRVVGNRVPWCSSCKIWHNQINSLAVAMYSAWVDDVATVLCCFNIQDMAPPE